MSPSGIQVNKSAVAVIFGVIVVLLIYKYPQVIHFFKTSKSTSVNSDQQQKSKCSGTMDIGKETVPESILTAAKTIKLTERTVEVSDKDKKVKIFIREFKPAEKSKGDILFLHGAKFSSEDWFKLGSLNITGALGYHTVAVDLPGKGKSDAVTVSDPADFLEHLIKEVQMTAPVIVSPSMSGMYSLPYLFKVPKDVLTRSRGYVPVAPVFTDKYTPEQYKSLQIPTAIVCGDEDKEIGPESVKNLSNLPRSKLYMLEKAKHPAYLDQPVVFHNILYNLLKYTNECS